MGSFAPLVAREGAEPGVALGSAASQAGRKRRNERGLEIADHWNPRECRKQQRGQTDEDRHSEPCSATTERACYELRAAERAECAARPTSDRLVPLTEREADGYAASDGERESEGKGDTSPGEKSCK
jgi:hypothetical protein